MSIELKVPEIGESITEVEIGEWFKQEGESVGKDDPIVSLESDKATVELSSPEAGTISKRLKQKGDVAKIGEVIGYLDNGKGAESGSSKSEVRAPELKAPEKSAAAPSTSAAERKAEEKKPSTEKPSAPDRDKPRNQRQLEDQEMPLSDTTLAQTPTPDRPKAEPPSPSPAPSKPAPAEATMPPANLEREEEVVPMSRLRRTVAERLVQAQRNAALLTTFNEADLSEVIALRKQYGESFLQKYQVKLGFMSFFVKATIDALKQFPALNAEVRGNDIVYHNYFDIGVAIGSGKGLVVPVLRRAERLSFAEIEMAIGDFGRRARENKLKPDELQGGTFTISNGGVYGSLLSTPIINPPQSGVLGMHAIQERPVARNGNVVIRPMMYLALTYDHRIVDGREAVSCLKRIVEAIEHPTRMLMEI